MAFFVCSFQERVVPCFQGDVMSTVWHVDFIWRKHKSVYLADGPNNDMTTPVRGHDDKLKAPWVWDRVGPGARQI